MPRESPAKTSRASSAPRRSAARPASPTRAAATATPPPPPPPPAEPATTRIAVVGIPASGKTTYFRYLSGHFGLNLPIIYIPSRRGLPLPLYADLEREVILEETTYEATNPLGRDSQVETTKRLYVNRPLQDPSHLFVELAAGREEEGVLTKYPLPTKYNQFVEMRLHFRFSPRGDPTDTRPMELHTVDEAGGIISDYFTYDRLWIPNPQEEVSPERCRVIPRFDTWKPERQELWRRGLTLMGRFVSDAEGIILLLTPQLGSLRDSAQQWNLARGVFRYCRMKGLPLVIAISKADLLKEFYLEVEQVLTSRGYLSNFDVQDFLTQRNGSGLGSILWAREGQGFRAAEDVFLISSAIATGEGRPLLYGDAGAEAAGVDGAAPGIPVMVNTTLPLARICQRILERRGGAGAA